MPPPPKRPPGKPPEDEEGPATFYVKMDAEGNPIDAPPPEAPAGKAPKKGLQVSIPDDDESTQPPPRKKAAPVAAPPPPNKKGRRGNWWDQKSAGEDEPTDEDPPPEEPEVNPDDAPGATAMLKVDEMPAPRKRRAAPREDPEPPPEVDDSEQPTYQPLSRRPAPQAKRPRQPEPEPQAPADDGRTMMLDVRNMPSPEEMRQQAAKAAAKSGDAPAAAQGGWSVAKVAAILLALAMVCALIALVLYFVLRR